MRSQFLLSAILFHTVFAGACLFVAWREAGAASRRVRFLRDLVGLAVLAVLLAALLATLCPPADFTAMRLLAQALFGELPLLGLALVALHVRARRHLPAVAVGLGVVLLVAVYVEAYHREPQDLQVRRHTLDLTHGRPATGRLRIVHLSDLQTDRVGAHEERALREALHQHPDLIVMTGDFVQPRLLDTRARAGADLRSLLRRLDFDAPLGAFAVQGDTDRDWPSVLGGTKLRCLTSEVATLSLPGGRRLSLVGLTLFQSRGAAPEAIRALVERVPNDHLRIVLGHRPDFVMALAGRTRVDLALAGHTHGGQVVVPGFGPPVTHTALPRRYASGLNLFEGIPLHVSPGVGMERRTAPQIRFLCPPEVSVLDVTY